MFDFYYFKVSHDRTGKLSVGKFSERNEPKSISRFNERIVVGIIGPKNVFTVYPLLQLYEENIDVFLALNELSAFKL